MLDKVDGRFHVAGTPTIGRTWAELSAAARDDGDPLSVITDFQAASATFPFGAHVAVVDVDTETGRVELVRHIAVDDAGRILNPLLADGQRHGGIAQGAAQALLEEVRYDEDGNPVTSNLADYAAISATELPELRAGGDGDAHRREPARREGHRRERHDRLHARGAVRGGRRARRTSACATSTCRRAPSGCWRASSGQAASA